MNSHIRHTRKSVESPVTRLTPNIVAQCALPSATPTDGPSEGSQMGKARSRRHENDFHGPRGLCQATIDKVPDDVLLVFFDFYLDNKDIHWRRNFDEWHTLVHVCRRWRNLVFASPRRLDLRLLCGNNIKVRDMLDIWPALPIDVNGFWEQRWEMGLDDLIAALEHPDRVRSISLYHFPGPHGESHTAEMQVRFPELTELRYWSSGWWEPVLPDSFLGGSAPRLRTLWLTKVPFPAAPTLLLSASGLVDLKLDNIPPSGYIPPASMVACLSSLNKLTSLSLAFHSPRSRSDQPSPPPQSRVVLPALTKFAFDGTSEYSEDLVAHIDTPVLNNLHVIFFSKPVFHIPHLKQFIDRAKGLTPSKEAEMLIDSSSIHLNFHQPGGSTLGVRWGMFGLQVPSLALLCGQVSHLFSLVERLDLWSLYPARMGVMASTRFLEFFQLFTTTSGLNVSRDLVPLIASALQELIGARATEVLPNLRDLFLDASAEFGSVQEDLRPFVDARRLSGHPVAVHYLDESGRAVR